MSQRAPLPMTLALIITTPRSATLIQGAARLPLIYGGFYAGMVVGNFILAALPLLISEEAGKRLPDEKSYVKEIA